MGWTTACEGDSCADCGNPLDDGEEVYDDGQGLVCLDCHEERLDNDSGRWENEDEDLIDGVGFADPGGHSALRAATPSNPRNLPCPTCRAPNRLTPADRRAGYQCDSCADRAEGFGD